MPAADNDSRLKDATPESLMRTAIVITSIALLGTALNPLAGQDSRPGAGPASRPSPKAGASAVPAAIRTAEAIEADPAGFIACAIPRLRAKIKAAESDQSGLREALKKLDRFRRETDKKLASSDAVLSAFRNPFQASRGAWPLQVEGREYDEAEFMKEVERRLDERSLPAAVNHQVDLVAGEIDRKTLHLEQSNTIDRVTIDVLEAYKPMLSDPRRGQRPLPTSVEANLERALLSAYERLAKAEEPSATAVRTVEELMQAASSRKSRPTAAEFLKQKPESRK